VTHPAIDDDAAARLRDQIDPPADPTSSPGTAIVLRPPDPPKPTALARLKGAARKAAVPMIARLRQELDRAGAEELSGLRAEVAELRDEVARTRAEHAAELAALHEELAAQQGRRPST
jgi:hypothetical protein